MNLFLRRPSPTCTQYRLRRGVLASLLAALALVGCSTGGDFATGTGTGAGTGTGTGTGSGTGTGTGTGTTGTGTGTGTTGTGTGTGIGGTVTTGTGTGTGGTGTGTGAGSTVTTGTGTGTGTGGTGIGTGTGTGAGNYTGPSITLAVKAGGKPVVGAQVQLYAAGASGIGSGATSLLATAATTGSTGSVSIPATSYCPASSSLIYAISKGGSVGAASSANSGLWLMTALGPCANLTAGTSFVLDEVTTVAAAYALAPFYSIAGGVGASSTNLIGLTNAFATAATLADPVAGTSPGSTLPANAFSPAARIDSLANLLNTCTGSPSACSSLFSATTSNGAPTNTLDAIAKLAQNPALNVSTLYTQSTQSSAYSPALTNAPTDWTVFLIYTVPLPANGTESSPSGLGIDSQGNVWVANYFYFASKFSPTGAPLFTSSLFSGGLNNSYGLAIDLKDNAWIPNQQPYQSPGNIGSVTELSSSGSPLSGPAGYVTGGLDFPVAVAIDPDGATWVVDYGNSHVTLLNSSGVPFSGTTGYTTANLAIPVAVAIDANHFGWVANQASNVVIKAAPDGSSFTSFACCSGASGITIDQGNNVWVANFYGDSVSLISGSGQIVSSGAYTGAGSILRPQGIAVDGSGNIWVANYRNPWITELAGVNTTTPGESISPASVGFGADANLLEAYALAIDASGDIWVTNQGNSTLTKFIGMATPVKTPLSGLPKAP